MRAMKVKKVAAVVAAFALAAFGAGCTTNGDSVFNYIFVSMNAFPKLSVTCPDSEESRFQQACAEIKTLLDGVESSVSATDQTSSLSAFNAAEAGARVEIDRTAYEVLLLAKEAYERTDGFYNPAVYYSVQAFGFGGASSYPQSVQQLPTAEECRAYASLASHFGEVILESVNGAYYATKPAATVEVKGATLSMKIDLGGVGKGYATDLVNGILDEYGFSYGYFNFASSSMAVKKSAATSDGNYVMRLTNPRPAGASGADYAQFSVCDDVLSSSGDYEQYYELEGVRYCHIVDPFTGAPVQTGVISVTVVGGSAAENDAYTTAMMAMGTERALSFVNQWLASRRVVIAYAEGEEYKILTNIPNLVVTDERFTIVGSTAEGKILYGVGNVA